jgi:hypothetical protein
MAKKISQKCFVRFLKQILPFLISIISLNNFKKLYRFNFTTNKWQLLKTIGSIPNDTVASPALLLHKNLLICWGG